MIKTVNAPDGPLIRKFRLRDAVRIGTGMSPGLVIDTCYSLILRSLVILPSVISEKDDLYELVCRIKGINRF